MQEFKINPGRFETNSLGQPVAVFAGDPIELATDRQVVTDVVVNMANYTIDSVQKDVVSFAVEPYEFISG